MPREFIANIDTANEEIIRLDTQVEELTAQAASALASHNETLEAARIASDAAVSQAIVERDSLRVDLATARTQISTLQGQMDNANRDSIHAAAAAGVPPMSVTVEVDAPTKSEKQLKGLDRAIAGNVALQRKKV